jgi:N6-adenosine-specific RNA methylase IME4
MDDKTIVRLFLEEQKQKELKPSEIAALAEYLLQAEREGAEARRRANLKQGAARPEGERFPVRGRSLDRIGARFNLSGRTLGKILDMFEGGFGPQMDAVGLGRINGAYRRYQIQEEAKRIRSLPPLPQGPFGVIVLDPAWQYDKDAWRFSVSAPDYPTMTLEEIRKVDVPGLADQDCILWLWTTNKHMADALDLVRRWGFVHKTILTWVKDQMGAGEWLRGQTEHCLLAVRGRPVKTLTNQTTALQAPRGRHSEKPEEFYRLVESLCPGPKLELFARKPREGWVTHGLIEMPK